MDERWREILKGRTREILKGRTREVLNAALQPSMRSTLSTYVKDLEELRSVMSHILEILNRIEAGNGTLNLGKQYWMEPAGLLANRVRCIVQELIIQVGGLGAQIVEKDHNKVINSFPAPLYHSHYKTIRDIGETRDELYHMFRRIPIRLDWELDDLKRGKSSHLFNETDKCFGRDEDVNTVIDMVVDLNRDDDDGVDVDDQGGMEVVQPFVVSIVGFGGLGKTTLAQQIFDDKRVKQYFHQRVWVGGLQQVFDVSRIKELIIEATASGAAIGLPHLKQASRGRRLLLVLDGVRWGLSHDNWLQLKDTLLRHGCTKGSCILVTTRYEKVARVMETSHFHYLKPLPKDDCWSLFAEKAFKGISKHECSELVEIGSKIMKWSGGVPIFVNALGYIWSSRWRRGRWKYESQDGMLDIQPLEYKYVLSSTLVGDGVSSDSASYPCFQYCSLFPENSWIEKETAMQIWMAMKNSSSTYDWYLQCFDDMLLDPFFKDLERDEVDGSIIRFKMQSLPNYFTSCLEKGELLLIMSKVSPFSTFSTAKNLSLVCTKNTKSINAILDTDSILHLLLVFGNPPKLEVSPDIFDRFPYLKVLDLGGSGITELPDSLGQLHDLRYLNLSSTKIRKLPGSICNLRSLQTLKLSYSKLYELPKATTLLTSLRHLEIEGNYMNFLPKGIERLKDLQNLSEFIIGGKRGCSIRELGNLNILQGKLVISNLNKLVSRREEAKKAKLNQKDCVNCLVLDGDKSFNNKSMDLKKRFNSEALKHLYDKAMDFKMPKEVVMEMVFEGLEPHLNLKRLEIRNYIGCKFPSWIEKPLVNLVSLKLVKCGMVELLPPLGVLPSLKYLHIHGMARVKHLGCELYGEGNKVGFPKLECLTIEEMSIWEQWDLRVEKAEMPCLTKLLLRHCSMLLVLPCIPRSLIELALYDCPNLETLLDLPKSLKTFTLWRCHSLKLLPDLPGPMRKLIIFDCPSLMALPPLPEVLKELEIRNCPILEPVQCLPRTLRELRVGNWSVLKTLPHLPVMLKVLNICIFSELAWDIDTSLPHLEHLVLVCKDRWLRSLPNLPNLVSLKFMMSSELEVLPSGLSQLMTLKTLTIHFCPKLRSLPEELKQLTSLQKLCIVGSPCLIDRCRKERGHDWLKIAHVPYIEIDNKIQYN